MVEPKYRKLRQLRVKQNMSFDDMAKKLNISKPYYWQIEAGERNLYYKLAVKIADVFDLKPDEIFYEDYKKNNK